MLILRVFLLLFLSAPCYIPLYAQKGYRHEGKVIDESGQGVEGVLIKVDGTSQRSSFTGDFRVTSSTPLSKPQNIAVTDNRYELIEKDVQPMSDYFNITIRVKRVEYYEGRVTYQNGQSLEVEIAVFYDGTVYHTRSERNGRFRFKDVKHASDERPILSVNGSEVPDQYVYVRGDKRIDVVLPPDFLTKKTESLTPEPISVDTASTIVRRKSEAINTPIIQLQPAPLQPTSTENRRIEPQNNKEKPDTKTTDAGFKEIKAEADSIINGLEQSFRQIRTLGEQARDRVEGFLQKLDNLDDDQRAQLNEYLLTIRDLLKKNEEAYQSLSQHNEQLSLKIQELSNDKASMVSKLETEKKGRAKAEQEARRNIYIFFVILIFMIVFLVLVFLAWRRDREQRKLIERQTAELQKANDIILNHNQSLEEVVMQRTMQLQEVNKELDTFMYRSSHDLRRPITSLMGLMQVASMYDLSPEIAELHDKVKETAQGMDKLLRKLIMVSEINQNAVKRVPIDIQHLMDRLKNHFEPTLKAKKIVLDTNTDVASPIVCSPDLLYIVLFNLIENAVHFTAPGREDPQIIFNLKSDPEWINILIRDNGQGIPADHTDSVFEMFSVASEYSSGSGLGLFLVKKAVDKLGGSITLSSQAYEFTEVIVKLPQGTSVIP